MTATAPPHPLPENALRSAVVVNPAKVADLPRLRRTVTETLAAAGWPEPMWMETTVEDPGSGQATQAVRDGVDIVFACGGDGTVMACVTALAGTDVALAVLPAGTGNLLAANLGISGDLATGLEVVLQGDRRRIDVGSVGEQSFAVMAGMGFDAHMLDATNDNAKKRVGWLAYVAGALRHLRDRRCGSASRWTTGRRSPAVPARSWSRTWAGSPAGWVADRRPPRRRPARRGHPEPSNPAPLAGAELGRPPPPGRRRQHEDLHRDPGRQPRPAAPARR
jgi:hypothetical protein